MVTTLAVVAGATGAAFEPRVGLVLGLANLAADGLSMGASNYLGLKSELEQTGSSVEVEQPWRHGFATAAAFALAGVVPLLVYLVPACDPMRRFQGALALSLLTLAGLGASRSRFTNRSPWRGAIEMVVIAGSAAGAAYVLGLVVEPLLR